jgi:eukaryotic-like serine/threonine-protein kinase
MHHATPNDPPAGWWRRLWSQRSALASDNTSVAPVAAPLPPRFGRFQVTGLLGRGASGQVYLAEAAGEGRVAIKTLELDTALPAREQAEHRERFQRQAEVMRSLAHPDMVRLLDQGVAGGTPWIAMELALGVELSRYTRANRLLPEPVVLRIAARVAHALAHAHARGVVHRDLKPANIRVDLGSDSVKLLDFGVARVEDAAVTRTGVTLGTPAYMAPEQLTGDHADPRSDAYALGVMLYELLAGRLPYPATTLGELLRAVSAGHPEPLSQRRPDVPPGLADLVMRLLARHPGDRPQDLQQLAIDLLQWADELAPPAPS